MIKKLFIIGWLATLFASCTIQSNEPTYNCKFCNDTICVDFCRCDSSWNCQDTIAWVNTCDSLLQADSIYYQEMIDAINGE